MKEVKGGEGGWSKNSPTLNHVRPSITSASLLARPSGLGTIRSSFARFSFSMCFVTSSSKLAHCSAKSSMWSLETRFGLRLPSAVKFSRMTATIRLRRMNAPTSS